MSIQKTDYKEPEHVQKEEELKDSFFHAVKLFDQTKVPRKAPFPVDEYGGQGEDFSRNYLKKLNIRKERWRPVFVANTNMIKKNSAAGLPSIVEY